MDVAPGRQDLRAAQQVAAGHRPDELGVQRTDDAVDFAVEGQRRVERGHLLEQRRVELDRSRHDPLDRVDRQQLAARAGRSGDHVDPLGARRGFARDVQPLRDQLALDFVELGRQRADVAAIEVERRRLVGDQLGEIGQLVAARVRLTPAVDRGLEVGEALVDPRIGQRRCEIAHKGRPGAALGENPFRRVVGRIEVDVGQIADQPIGPAFGAQSGLLAGHELQAAVGAEMQHGVGAEILAEPAVERGEGVGRREPALEQQPHRVALIAQRGLDADEHVAELRAEDLHRGAVGLQLAGGGAPGGFDLGEMGLALDDRVGTDAGVDIRLRAVASGVAAEDALAHRIGRGGDIDGVAFTIEPLERRVERFEHRQELRGPGGSGVGREVEQNRGDALVGIGGATQLDELEHPRGQHLGALGAGLHRAHLPRRGKSAAPPAAGTRRTGAVGAAAEHHRHGAAVQLGDRDHHRRFERQQSLTIRGPGLQRLELDRMGGEIRPVELRQDRFGGDGVVVRRPAHQAEAGQVHHRVDGGDAVLHEQLFDRRAAVESAGERRDHVQPARLHRRDHAVIMARVLRQHIGAQHQQPDRPLGVAAAGSSAAVRAIRCAKAE